MEFSTRGCSSMLGTIWARVSGAMCFSTASVGPKRTISMSRYSSIDSISSRRVTKCSWLRSRRRSSPDSLPMSMRAVSGCERISDEMDVSVLNRKWGLIWLASASTRACISSFSCSCSRCSMRAAFQILMGTATDITVVTTITATSQTSVGSRANRRWGPNRAARACRSSSRLMGPAIRVSCQSMRNRPASRQVWRRRAVTSSGLTCQMASLGHSSRSPPPANPQPTMTTRAIHSPAIRAGAPTRPPTMAPA